MDTEFVKSSFSGAECCVEVGAGFRKAIASNPNGSCVEVAADVKADSSCGPEEIVVRVRDSKQRDAQGNPNGPVLEFTTAEWDAFLQGMDAGPMCEFRVILPGGNGGNAEVSKSVGVACP